MPFYGWVLDWTVVLERGWVDGTRARQLPSSCVKAAFPKVLEVRGKHIYTRKYDMWTKHIHQTTCVLTHLDKLVCGGVVDCEVLAALTPDLTWVMKQGCQCSRG